MSVFKDKVGGVEFKIENYTFESFSHVLDDEDVNTPKNFQFQEINKASSEILKQERVIKAERTAAEKNNFKVAPVVLEHRGLLDQEKRERELKIQNEVEKRVAILKDRAYEEGFNEGLERGRQEVYEQTKKEVEDKLSSLTEMIGDVLSSQNHLLDNYKRDIYQTVKSLTKWVILRELKEDDQYLNRLLEKLIIEINTKSNLLIKVGGKSFEKMPEVLEVVQAKMGNLSNTRLEVDHELGDYGLIVESENGIVNASFDQQLRAIDALFETLGVKTDHEE